MAIKKLSDFIPSKGSYSQDISVNTTLDVGLGRFQFVNALISGLSVYLPSAAVAGIETVYIENSGAEAFDIYGGSLLKRMYPGESLVFIYLGSSTGWKMFANIEQPVREYVLADDINQDMAFSTGSTNTTDIPANSRIIEMGTFGTATYFLSHTSQTVKAIKLENDVVSIVGTGTIPMTIVDSRCGGPCALDSTTFAIATHIATPQIILGSFTLDGTFSWGPITVAYNENAHTGAEIGCQPIGPGQLGVVWRRGPVVGGRGIAGTWSGLTPVFNPADVFDWYTSNYIVYVDTAPYDSTSFLVAYGASGFAFPGIGKLNFSGTSYLGIEGINDGVFGWGNGSNNIKQIDSTTFMSSAITTPNGSNPRVQASRSIQTGPTTWESSYIPDTAILIGSSGQAIIGANDKNKALLGYFGSMRVVTFSDTPGATATVNPVATSIVEFGATGNIREIQPIGNDTFLVTTTDSVQFLASIEEDYDGVKFLGNVKIEGDFDGLVYTSNIRQSLGGVETALKANHTYILSGGVTVSLPGVPQAGDWVEIIDKDNDYSTNPVLIAANLIEGVASTTVTLNVDGSTTKLIYVDGTFGWKLVK